MIEREKISSINEFKDFLKTNIWHDIQNELLDWLDVIHCQLEDPSVGSTELPGGITDKELHRLGGNAETIRKDLIVGKKWSKN